MAKQVVFMVTTDKDGNAEALGECKVRGRLSGDVRKIEYFPDNRVPFEAGVNFSFSTAVGGLTVLEAEKVTGREIWNLSGPEMKDEAIRVIVTEGGKGRSGAFVVTCA